MKLEIKQIGDATVLVLPDDLLSRLGWEQGEAVHASEAPDGSIRIAPRDPARERVLETARELFVAYRETFEELAK